MFIYSTNIAKSHSCGDEDLINKIPVFVSRCEQLKTKDSSQTFISEDLSWDIFLPRNCNILSKYIFSERFKTIQLAIINGQCPSVTRVTILIRIYLYS